MPRSFQETRPSIGSERQQECVPFATERNVSGRAYVAIHFAGRRVLAAALLSWRSDILRYRANTPGSTGLVDGKGMRKYIHTPTQGFCLHLLGRVRGGTLRFSLVGRIAFPFLGNASLCTQQHPQREGVSGDETDRGEEGGGGGGCARTLSDNDLG